jgi:hypothetical protein
MDKKTVKKRKPAKRPKPKRSCKTKTKNQPGITEMLTENIQDYIKGIIGSSIEEDDGEFDQSSCDYQIMDAPVCKRTRSSKRSDLRRVPKVDGESISKLKNYLPPKEDVPKSEIRSDVKLEENQTKELSKMHKIVAQKDEHKSPKQEKSLKENSSNKKPTQKCYHDERFGRSYDASMSPDKLFRLEGKYSKPKSELTHGGHHDYNCKNKLLRHFYDYIMARDNHYKDMVRMFEKDRVSLFTAYPCCANIENFKPDN